MRKLIGFILAIMAVCGTTLMAFAKDGNVIYKGDSRTFIFDPGSVYSPTDMFPDLKDVMPGDSICQKILINNDYTGQVKINVYLRALGAQEGSGDFLSKLKLRVEEPAGAVLFDAPSDQSAQLSDWVHLGTLYSGGQVTLDVILEVPVELDTAYKNQVGYLDWEFMVVELPVEEADPKPPVIPSTGDNTQLYLYGTIVLCAGSMLVILLRRAAG